MILSQVVHVAHLPQKVVNLLDLRVSGVIEITMRVEELDADAKWERRQWMYLDDK